MAEIQHLAMCTKNNRRLARFYHYIFGFEEVWNRFQNSPYSFYMSDGYLNLNCLQIRSGSSYNRMVDGKEIMPDVGINHVGFWVKSVKEIENRLAAVTPRRNLWRVPRMAATKSGGSRILTVLSSRSRKAAGKREEQKGSPR